MRVWGSDSDGRGLLLICCALRVSYVALALKIEGEPLKSHLRQLQHGVPQDLLAGLGVQEADLPRLLSTEAGFGAQGSGGLKAS